jgi:hypothetical protein
MRVVAHRWLEHMDGLGVLRHIRKLNIVIHRTFAAITWKTWLEHLIIDLDMGCS